MKKKWCRFLVVLASLAFPIAFPPQRIDYCMIEVTADTTGKECKKPQFTGRFIDGGVFDNNPLRLAHRIAASGLVRGRDGRLIPRYEQKPEEYLYVYVDPDHASYPNVSTAPESRTTESSAPQEGENDGVDVLRFIPSFFGSFVASARSAELYALIEEYPEVREQSRPWLSCSSPT